MNNNILIRHTVNEGCLGEAFYQPICGQEFRAIAFWVNNSIIKPLIHAN